MERVGGVIWSDGFAVLKGCVDSLADLFVFRDKSQGSGGSATSRKDERNSTQKAKEEFPEAPTVIGMQDERGGKGN